MANLNEVPDLAEEVDYYAWLGVDRSVSRDEINKAYRHLSRVFHPDKHQGAVKKQHAAQQFNKIKKAYEVLTNPLHKAIYDAAGVQGLKMEGWQIQDRYRSSKEILDEMERMKVEEEEKKLRQCTNAKGSILVGVNATDIFDTYEYNVDYPSLLPSIEISETQIKQSVECPITTKDTVLLSGSLNTKNGKGSSDLGLTYRKVMTDKITAQTDVRVGSKPGFGFSLLSSLWKNGSGSIGTQFQLTPDGSLVPLYSLNVTHQFDTHTRGSIGFIGGVNSGVETSLVYMRKSHLGVVGCQVGIPISFVHCQYTYNHNRLHCKLKLSARLSTMGYAFEYNCSKKITSFSTLSGGVSISSSTGVVLKIGLTRGSQSFQTPIHLSETIDSPAIFYGTIVPIVTYLALKKFIVDPYLDKQLKNDLKLQKERHAELLTQRKQEAAQAMDLMSELIQRSYEVEEGVDGLVIEVALYGKDVEDKSSCECIEVARCLQALVKGSFLTINQHTKLHSLPGFYDPCFGEEKYLLVEYSFRKQHHQHIFKEGQDIVLPSDAHRKTTP